MANCIICGHPLKEKNEKKGRKECAKCIITRRVFGQSLASRKSRAAVAKKHLEALPEEVIHTLITKSKY